MKRILLISLMLCSLLAGCSSSEYPQKIEGDMLAKFPSDAQTIIEETNTKLVDMKYLDKNKDEFGVDLTSGSDRNDIYVMVKGIVNETKETFLGDILKDRVASMSDSVSFKIYLEDSDEPLSMSYHRDTEIAPDIEEGTEYYFLVTVDAPKTEEETQYNFNVIEFYDLN